MTENNAGDNILNKLKTVYESGEAQAITRLVLEYSTDKSHINSTNKKTLEVIVNELLEYKPIQYVLNEAWFWNLKFCVNENVLIPRPETEELVKYLLDNYKGKLLNQEELSILDIGSGSGCVPIALKKELPQAQITSIDVSAGALTVARQNADTLQAEIAFAELDFLNENNWEKLGTFSVIVSNPPYIPLQEKQMLDKNVTEWEPGTALFVPDNDPLLFYRKIAFFGKTHLTPKGSIFLECHQHFAQATLGLFLSQGYSAELKTDIFDNERMVRAWLGQ